RLGRAPDLPGRSVGPRVRARTDRWVPHGLDPCRGDRRRGGGPVRKSPRPPDGRRLLADPRDGDLLAGRAPAPLPARGGPPRAPRGRGSGAAGAGGGPRAPGRRPPAPWMGGAPPRGAPPPPSRGRRSSAGQGGGFKSRGAGVPPPPPLPPIPAFGCPFLPR